MFFFIKVVAFNKSIFFTFLTFDPFHQKVDLMFESLINFSPQGGSFYIHPYLSIKVSYRLDKHLSTCFLILLFFLQFAEFKFKAPSYSKTLHYLRISISHTLPQFRCIYNQDRGNSSCVNVAF